MTDTEQRPTTRPVGAVAPDRLLDRIDSPRPRSGLAAGAARTLINTLLQRTGRHQGGGDELVIVEPDGTETRHSSVPGGDPDHGLEPLSASITVVDPRAWVAIATEGSIGLGRGYLEGWWTSPDPTSVVRIIVRRLEPLDELRNRIEASTGAITNRVRRLLPGPGRRRNATDIASHYDLGNEFFALFLDDTMTYSSAVFPEPNVDLTTASLAKYDRLLAKLEVTSSDDVLEIGTGWGGFAIRAAQATGASVTTTTVSAEQRREAIDRVAAAGLDHRITVLGDDWRDLEGRYDRIVSVEMIEAVDWRQYPRFFATIEGSLAPDGLVGLQAICVPDRRYERTKKTEDFIRRFVFPGGHLPSIGAITRAVATSTRLQLIDVEDLSAHYAETLRRWRVRFDGRRVEAIELGLDRRFCRLWDFYLAYCEAGFLERHCTVNQFVLAGPRWRPDGLTLRPC